MAFTNFKSIQQVQEKFNIRYIEESYLQYDTLEPSVTLVNELEFNRHHIDVFSSEYSRCENVIYPLIRDVYKHYVADYALWSHRALSYNEVLTGVPDYLITSKSALGKTVLGLPVVVVVEAKQNNFMEGWGQCLAELLVAQKINKDEQFPIHGIVTDGEMWHFGKLVADLFTKNEEVLVISDLGKICGALSYLIKDSLRYIKDEFNNEK